MIGRRNFRHSSEQVRTLGIFMFFLAFFATSFAQAQVLFGDQTVEAGVDSNAVGQAEAFQTTATTSGTVGSLTLYVNSTNSATTIYLGLYADNAGHPGTLLAQGRSSTLTKSAWNTIAIPSASVTTGSRYWIAILGTTGGKPYFRDRSSGSCASETNKQTALTQLPATWTTGIVYHDCPISAYGTAVVATGPVLSLSSSNMAFSAVSGRPDPAPISVNVANTGIGTLSYTTGSDAAWLSVTPPSGSAPSSLQISASAAGLSMGSYTGHVTVTASGAQNSPATITVNLTVAAPADWSMVDHDPSRSGNAVEETIITPSNVGNLSLTWSVPVDGPVTAQPLFASGVTLGAQTKDLVVVGTGGNSIYAFDAATGSTIWRRNFGSQPGNCAISSGFGVTGAPLIDRATNRVYAVSNDGVFRTVSLLDGTDAATALTLVANPNTNKVWGGLNKIGNYVYVATASDGCDAQPWKGQVYRIDVSTNPVLVNTFVVVPGIPGSDPGGGIWGYGGVSADPATGNIYGASGADVNEKYTPYGDRVIELDGALNVLGSYGPPEPVSYPCNGAPCDLDFGATPLVFQPAGCSTMAVVGNKNGNLYLFRASDLAASSAPLQVITLNPANDYLGAGGVGGNPAYWPTGNMVYVTDAGPGVSGISSGVIGLSVTNSCTLAVAWSTPMGVTGNANSTPTVANGVVFAGDGTGPVHAFDALTGTLLWSSSQYAANATYAAPTVAQGHVYAGSWSSGGGIVGAFSLNASSQVLAVSPQNIPFSAVQGGSNPASATVSVTNTGTGVLTFTAASDSAWLGVTPNGGSAPQNLQVSANISGLTPNTYRGHITVTASGAQGSPVTITVTLVVSAPQPILTVSTNALTFSGTQGGSNPASQSVGVSNTGGGSLVFTAASDSAWLTVNPTGGSAPQTLQVSANITGLAPNTYTGHITVTATGVQGSPQTVTVTLVVSAPPPVLTISTTALNFSGTQGGSNPASQSVGVSNTGGGSLTFTAASDGAWLTVNPTGGSAPQTLQVSANITGLAPNTYTGHITVTAAGVQGSPAIVTVKLTVSSSSSTILLGDQTIESSLDSNTNGEAEAFQATSNVAGTLTALSIYVDSTSTSTRMYVGAYADNNGNPGTLLTQGSATPTKGAWNTVNVPSANISSATPYWIAVLGTTSGKLIFRDRSLGSCKSQVSSVSTLTALPATWSSGTKYSDCPISAYGANSTAAVATTIAVAGGNHQSGPPGTKLAQALTVLVTDQYGNPFSGSSVTFSDNGAGGTFSNANPVVTGANGTAAQMYTFSSSAATVTINATATGISSPAIFTENSVVLVANQIAVAGGNNQSAAPGTQLPQLLTVLVSDQFGNPLSGRSVTFSDNSAGGTLSSANPVTGANGTATQTYTLPSFPATVTINATAGGVSSPAVFTENSVAPFAPKIVVTGGNNQFGAPGTLLPQSLTVRVTDQHNNPVSGNSVTFSDNGAGGTFSNGNPVVTGANGTATQTYILPGSSRNVTINATATGISSPAVFSETSGASLATIARDGSCSAAFVSCTFNATATGDLKIVFAYRSASTTAPSVASGWTNIATFATATGGTTAAVTVGCEVSSSSGDTGSGTWMNASAVVGVSYSGTNVGTTANCNQTGIGQLAMNSAKTSATADFPALNPMMYGSGSWVVGFAGNSAGGLCTPSGMSSVSTAGSGPAILVSDTNGPAASWSDQTCPVTSGTWINYVIEVIPQQGFTLIQSAENPSCASGTTCAITLAQPTTPGDLYYYSCYAKDHPVIVSADKGGKVLTPTSCISHVNSTVYSCGYTLPADTTAATSPITLTMSTAASGAGACRFWEFKPNTTGKVDLDAAFVADQPSGTAPVGPTLAATGSRPIYIQNAISSSSITAETFPYSRQQATDARGASWSSAISPANATPPSWTVSPGISSTQGVAFSFDPTPCSSVGVIDWSGGTNGNTVAVADVAASTFGMSTGRASGSNNWWLSTSPATGMTYTTSAFKALTTPRRLCGGGTTTSGTGTLGLKYDLSTPVAKYVEYQFNTPSKAISMGFWMQTNVGNVNQLYDFANLATWPTFGAATAVHHINNTIEMECYGGTTNKTVIAVVSPNTWYWVTLQLNTSGGAAAVYDANGVPLGSGTCTPLGWTFSGLGDMGIGKPGSDGDHPAGAYYYFGTVVFDTMGSFPILP